MSALHKHFVLQMLGRARFRSDHTPQRRYNEATEMNGIPTFEPRRRAYQSGSWLAANSSWLGSHFLPRAPVRGGSSQNPKRLKTAGGLLNEACESAHAQLTRGEGQPTAVVAHHRVQRDHVTGERARGDPAVGAVAPDAHLVLEATVRGVVLDDLLLVPLGLWLVLKLMPPAVMARAP